jgi:hypothetical protein
LDFLLADASIEGGIGLEVASEGSLGGRTEGLGAADAGQSAGEVVVVLLDGVSAGAGDGAVWWSRSGDRMRIQLTLGADYID